MSINMRMNMKRIFLAVWGVFLLCGFTASRNPAAWAAITNENELKTAINNATEGATITIPKNTTIKLTSEIQITKKITLIAKTLEKYQK